MNIIGVIGSGTMGNGIAHVSSLSGHKVIFTTSFLANSL